MWDPYLRHRLSTHIYIHFGAWVYPSTQHMIIWNPILYYLTSSVFDYVFFSM